MNSSRIKAMTDTQLIESTEKMVRHERQVVECLIWHLQEIQDRKLFIQMGYTSLYNCLVKHFKYSETVAYSRIAALKIISEVPEIAESLNCGEVNLTTLSLTQSFIRKQEKESGEKLSTDQKIQYLDCIKNKSTDEVKQIFATIDSAQELPRDKVVYLSETHAQLQATIEKSILEKIERVKSLISHENLNPNYNELLHQALDALIEKTEKKKGISQKARSNKSNAFAENSNNPATQSFAVRKTTLGNNPNSTQIASAKKGNGPTVENTQDIPEHKNSRYIPRSVKQFVFQRSNGHCEFIHSNGERCNSKFQIQYDHIKAFSRGGLSTAENIQHLCRVHNAHKSAK